MHVSGLLLAVGVCRADDLGGLCDDMTTNPPIYSRRSVGQAVRTRLIAIGSSSTHGNLRRCRY